MSLSQVLVINFVLFPVLRRVLQPSSKKSGDVPKTGRNQAIKAGLICLVFILGTVGLHLMSGDDSGTGPNLYRILNVKRSTPPQGIRAAYRRRSKELHPDRAEDAEDSEAFEELVRARDILSDAELRSVYDTMGYSFAMDKLAIEKYHAGIPVFFFVLPYYVAMLLLIFTLTLSSPRRKNARAWCLLLIASTFFIELMMRMSAWDVFPSLFPYTTIAEKADIMRICVPILLQLLVFIGELYFVDIELQRFLILKQEIDLILEMLDSEPWKEEKSPKKDKEAVTAETAKPRNFKEKLAFMKKKEQMENKVQQQRQQGGIPIGLIIFVGMMLLQWFLK